MTGDNLQRLTGLSGHLTDYVDPRQEPPAAPGPDVEHGGTPTRSAVRPIQLLTIEELGALPEPTWLVDTWLPEHGLTILYGPSGSFKSFLTLAWSLHVAAGTPWHGSDVGRGQVVYLSLEGGYGLAKRIAAWKANNPDAYPDGNFRAVAVGLSLLNPAKVDELLAAVRAAFTDPVLIVVDTMARAMPGGDENSSTDVGKLIAACGLMVEAWDASVVLVHHTGHAATARERGHSSLPAAADCRIGLTRSGTTVKVEQLKAKDHEERAPITLRTRPLGRSLVLDHIGPATTEVAADDTSERCQDAVLSALTDADGPLSKNAVEMQVKDALRVGSVRVRDALDVLIAKRRITVTTKGRTHLVALANTPEPSTSPPDALTSSGFAYSPGLKAQAR